MTSLIPAPRRTEVFYPSSDGEPLAETSIHIDAIINAVVTLRHYFAEQQVIVLTNQFLYYAEGFPKLRVAPDIMVVLHVSPGPRDNYKTWEEKQTPAVIFEVTSAGTREQDETLKKTLYEQLEIQEYWQFDPKGEWISEKLRGYRLQGEAYIPITDGHSQPLQLRLEVDGQLIAFYRQDSGEKLPAPNDLLEALRQETLARQAAEAQLEQERQRAEQECQRAEQERQRAEQERQRAEQERQRAEQERQRAEQAETEAQRLREQLRALGVDPNI